MSARPLLLTLLAILALRGLTLGSLAVGDTTESRYYLVARHMARSGDWVTPYVLEEGRWQPYWGKPPLHFWLTALAFRLLGESAFTARLPSYVAALLLVWATYRTGRRLGGPVHGLAAALLLATMVLFLLLAGAVVVDMTFAAAVAGALAAYAAHAAGTGRLPGYLFFLALGLALLAKGPTAFPLVGLPLALWAACRPEGRKALKRLPWIPGGVLCLLVALPWYLLAERATPGFLRYFLLNEHIYRYLRADYGDLYGRGHDYFFGAVWPMLLGALLPWTAAVAAAARKGRNPARAPVFFLWAWGLTPPLFFTPARNLLISYLLPGLPALALLGAEAVARARWPRFAARLLWAAALGAAAAGISLGTPPGEAVLFAGATLLLGVWLRRLAPLPALALAAAWLLLGGPWVLREWVDGRRSTAPLLRQAESVLPAETSVVFAGGPPRSAVVYAPARVDPARRESLAELLKDRRREVIALKAKDWERLGPERRHLRLLARAGLWVLASEAP